MSKQVEFFQSLHNPEIRFSNILLILFFIGDISAFFTFKVCQIMVIFTSLLVEETIS